MAVDDQYWATFSSLENAIGQTTVDTVSLLEKVRIPGTDQDMEILSCHLWVSMDPGPDHF